MGQNHHGNEKKWKGPNQNDELIRGKLVCSPQLLQETWFVYFCTSFFFLMFGGVRFSSPVRSITEATDTWMLRISPAHFLLRGRKNHQMVWGNEAMLVGEHCELSIAMLYCWWLTSSCLCLEPISRSKRVLVLLWSDRFTSPSITLFKPIPTSQRQRLPVGFQYIQNIDEGAMPTTYSTCGVSKTLWIMMKHGTN